MRRTKHRLPLSRGKIGWSYLWLLLLLPAAVAVWFFWSSGKKAEPQSKQKPVPSSVAPRAPQPTNLPSVTTPSPTPRVVAATNISATAPGFAPSSVQNVFDAQVALARQSISPGSIDGVIGSQTRAALRAFQQLEHLRASGELDEATRARLTLDAPTYASYTVTTNDLLRLRPLGTSWLAKSQQDRLDYESILELVAEGAQSHPNLIRRLNPDLNWTNLVAGATVQIPNVEKIPPRTRAAFVRIHLADRNLQAFDSSTNLLAHFPCSIARNVEKRPVGELHVADVAEHPNYTFDPDNFPESPEARQLGRKLILPAGPNNPVGTAWISLDKPGYGIHGTPRPEEVGRTESHGCFRLANWNAEYLIKLVNVGTPVFVEP